MVNNNKNNTSILNIINWKVFLISFLLGLIFIWINDDKKKILVYPTLSNIETIEYKDIADNCFEYSIETTECPSKTSDIYTIPVQ